MSAIEKSNSEIALPVAPPVASDAAGESKARASKKEKSFITKILDLLSSVRFGIALLVLLIAASMLGMLIQQQSVDGFDKYYYGLSPATQLLFGALGFFDIYHTWYFNALLLVLSLNIVLASIDRFPSAWTYISRPKLDASAKWLKGQEQNATLEMQGESREGIAARIATAAKSLGFKTRVTEKNGKTFVFAERGAWNRLGAYAVHVALLTIFAGGFLTAQLGATGQMPLKPGATASGMTEFNFTLDKTSGPQIVPHTMQLPFKVTCLDIQQKLIRKDGPITAENTIDWLTPIRIEDETGAHEALVHLNAPFDYRGYRFFQASFTQPGRARNIVLNLTPEAGGDTQQVTIKRDGSATLADGTKLQFVDFFPDFTLEGGQPSTASDEYVNPAALLTITKPNGETLRAYAFGKIPDNAPIGRPVGGYKIRLADYEKVPNQHILSIQHDPGATIVYIGFASLALTLVAVFFFSHQRVWALVEDKAANNFAVIFGGNTNRNKVGFEDRFKKLVGALSGANEEAKAV